MTHSVLKKTVAVVRRLAKASEGSKGLCALNACTGILSVGASLFFIWVTKHIVDIATGGSDAPWGAAVVMLAAALAAQLALGALSQRFSVICRTRISNRTRAELFSRLMRGVWTGRNRFHSSDAVNRLSGDVATVSSTVAVTLPGIAVTTVQLLAAFVFLAVLDLRMAIALALIMPLALLLSKAYMRRSHRLTRDIRKSESDMQCIMQEHLELRVLISSLRRTRESVRRFTDAQDNFYSKVMQRSDISIFAGSAVTAGFMIGYAAAFLWCADGLRTGTVTFGTMTAFLQLVSRIQRPVVDLASKIPALIQASVAVERIDEIYDMPAEPVDGDLPVSASPLSLRLNDVAFAYTPGEYIIDGFSHSFKPGTVTAIAGTTGTGKTTLLMLMLGMLRPDRGSVTLQREDEPALDVTANTRANIVYVPQGNSLLSGTIRSNLLMGCPDATEAMLAEALRQAAADFVLELPMSLDSPCGERGSGLSEGQAQRIAIARGLLGRGKILILDEPSSALDTTTEGLLIESLRRVAKTKTVIVVSHSPTLLAACDTVIRL